MFILPKKVIKSVESLFRAFLWSGCELKKYGAKVAWDKICSPKNEGGLGFKSLDVWNKSAIAKHVWFLFSGGDQSVRVESMFVRKILVPNLNSLAKMSGTNIYIYIFLLSFCRFMEHVFSERSEILYCVLSVVRLYTVCFGCNLAVTLCFCVVDRLCSCLPVLLIGLLDCFKTIAGRNGYKGCLLETFA